MNEYYVNCRFSLEAIRNKSVEFQIGLPEGGKECGTGILRAWNSPESGKLIIAIDSPNPPAQRYRLNQYGVDRIERHQSEIADFVCILPDYGFSSKSEGH